MTVLSLGAISSGLKLTTDEFQLEFSYEVQIHKKTAIQINFLMDIMDHHEKIKPSKSFVCDKHLF